EPSPQRLTPPLPAPLRRRRAPGPMPPLRESLDEFGLLDLKFANPPQRISHIRPLRRELAIVRQVLQLTSTTVIVHVVRARRGDAMGTGLDDLASFRAREVAVPLERTLTQANPIARDGARHEHD